MRRVAVVGCAGSGKSPPVPPVTAVRGVLSRRLRYGAGQHGGGVYNRVSGQFLRYVLSYRRRMRPRALAAVAGYGGHAELVRLGGRAQVGRWPRAVTGGSGR
jgi:hypothetical protein